MTKIVFLDKGTLARQNFNFDFPFELTNHDLCPPDEVSKALNGHQIAITNKVKITRAHMEANPQLKLIAVAATGFNIVDVDAAKELGVTVCNVKGYSTTGVAEHVFMMMISLMHRLPTYQKRMNQGQWQKSPYFYIIGEPIYNLAGKTLGIIGNGDIGSAFAKFAQAFGMNVLFSEHKNMWTCREGYTPFCDVIQEADVISIHCPLTEQTNNLIDAAEIKQMKDGVILLNVSRGGLINEAALIDALKSGKLGGAGVDVATTEPPLANNPLLDTTLDNFILTPHTAWASEESIEQLVRLLEDNINSFMKGSPINVVS